jgi:Trypsin
MRGFKFSVVAVALVWALSAAPAQAITFGHLDGNVHPYAGALVAAYHLDRPGVKDVLCSGTLIAPRVFLTAAHCTDFLPSRGVGRHDVWVTFDASFTQSSSLIRGTYHQHPDYGYSGHGGFSDPHDLSVIVLDRAVTWIAPARLPKRSLLNGLERTQRYTAVGYGTVRAIKQTGPNAFSWDPKRRAVDQSFRSLTKSWLNLSENPSTGSGGTCYGDSGGPHFLQGTNMVVAITVTGDAACRATDVDYRLDTASAQSFLGRWVTLPS